MTNESTKEQIKAVLPTITDALTLLVNAIEKHYDNQILTMNMNSFMRVATDYHSGYLFCSACASTYALMELNNINEAQMVSRLRSEKEPMKEMTFLTRVKFYHSYYCSVFESALDSARCGNLDRLFAYYNINFTHHIHAIRFALHEESSFFDTDNTAEYPWLIATYREHIEYLKTLGL